MEELSAVPAYKMLPRLSVQDKESSDQPFQHSRMRSQGVLAFVAGLAEVQAFWRLSCSNIQAGRLDPIINPGVVSPHSHIIAGPINFNISSTYDTLAASFCTSCSIQADRSAYWTPMMYYQKADGTFKNVRNDGTVVYYLGRGENVNKTVPFPKGFRMVSGDPFARKYDSTVKTYGTAQNPSRAISERVSFACLGANYANGSETYGMYYTNCPNGLRAQVHFPSCWNGVDLYKSDQSHVAYLSQIDNGICPPTHQVRIPHLFFELYYFPNEIDTSDGGRFVFAQGDPTGFGFHGDFLNGWDNNVLTDGINQCLVGNANGVVENCAPFLPSNDQHTAQNCPEQPSYYNEAVRGTLPSLPGCNPVQPGPSRATPVTGCTVTPTANPPTKNLDYQTRTAPTAGATASTSAGSATYAGCFSEPSNGRGLPQASYSDDGMTTQSCASYCSNKGWSVFGTEYGRECYCGTAVPADTAPETDCRTACQGDISQYCGGGRRLSVWKLPGSSLGTSNIVAPSGTSYLGCYSDNTGTRTLTGNQFNSDSLTYNICAQYAKDNNYQYFGVEYSKECYAGNVIASGSTQIAEGNCNMACSGASTSVCGGAGSINLFKNSGYIKPAAPATVTVGNSVYNYQQCITEGTNGRALNSASTSSDTLTVESCVQFCANGGYKYAGVEYGRECYCNNAGPVNGAGPASDGETGCSKLCAGSKTEICGGSQRLGLYKLQGASRIKRA